MIDRQPWKRLSLGDRSRNGQTRALCFSSQVFKWPESVPVPGRFHSRGRSAGFSVPTDVELGVVDPSQEKGLFANDTLPRHGARPRECRQFLRVGGAGTKVGRASDRGGRNRGL